MLNVCCAVLFLLLGTPYAVVQGWTTSVFPNVATDVPSVALYGSKAAALYPTTTGYAYALSDDRGKTWGASIPIPDVPLSANATLKASGNEAFMFFTSDTISAFRLNGSEFTSVTAPVTADDVNNIVKTWKRERTSLLGATACGTNCFAILYGVIYSHGSDWGYYLDFKISKDHGATWQAHLVETWTHPRTSFHHVELTAADLAWHHNVFMIGMSSRSSPDDSIHKNTWRYSTDGGANWNRFNGWDEFRHYQSPLVDLQIVGRRSGRWSAVGFLENGESLLISGIEGEDNWADSVPLESTGYFALVEFHQGLLALLPSGGGIGQKISTHAGITWGAISTIVPVDTSFNTFSPGWDRHVSFKLPYGLVSVKTSNGNNLMLSFEDCGPSTTDISGDTVPYTCCRYAGCATPTPPSPTPKPAPKPPAIPQPQPGWNLHFDMKYVGGGILILFLGTSVLMAVISIIVRRARGTSYTNLTLIQNNEKDSDSDDVRLDSA